jgi:hypothetical protein
VDAVPADPSSTRILLGKCGSNLNQIAHRLDSDENVSRAMIVKALADLREISAALLKSLGK